MRAWVAVWVVVAAAGAVRAQVPTIPSLPGFARSPREREEASLARLRPAPLELMPQGFQPASGEPRTIRLRVFAARDYREQKFNWTAKFRRLIDRVNRAVERWPGVRFEIVETKNWDRDTVASSPDELVAELERLDPGRDVDLVIGLVASLPIVPTQIHQIGVARELGRHVLLRSLHDVAERAMLQREYGALSDVERDAILLERLPHKEAVVFLHEWAHSLGALHVAHSDLIMNTTYDNGQRRFDAANGRLIELALASRGAGDDDATFRRKVGDYVQKTQSEDWDPKSRESMLSTLSGRAPAAPPEKLADADRAAMAKVKSFYDAKDFELAWSAVAEVVARHPRDARIQSVACDVAAARAAGAARLRAAEAACGAAAGLDPGDARAALTLARVYVDEHVDAKLPAALTRARERVEHSAEAKPEYWAWLAEAYAGARSPSRAIEAAAHADEGTARRVNEWAARLRRRSGLPAGALPPDREPEFLGAFELAAAALDGPAHETAAMLVANLERDFASVPGAAVLGCERDVKFAKPAVAERSCARALAAAADSPEANFYVGVFEAQRGHARAAAAHLQRTVELTPELEPPWRALASIHRKTGDRAALDALRAGYAKQFGKPLP